jgi:hypothetical protein
MSIPTSRQEFSAFCMRKLGSPVIQVNLSEEQVDDAIDQALYFWQEYAMDGNDKVYYKYQITGTDIANGYFTLPSNIIGAVKLFPVGEAISTNFLFNTRYQFVMNDLYSLANVTLVPYYMTMQHLQLLEEILVGITPIRYNRHSNLLYFDSGSIDIVDGIWVVLECYGIIDPEIYADVWRDKWLQDYTICLCKKQWGWNLTKFTVALPSGMQLNGQKMYDSAQADLDKMENTLINQYSLPSAVFIA